MLITIPYFYCQGVLSHPNIYNTSVLYLGKPMNNRQPADNSHLHQMHTKSFQVRSCEVWNIIALCLCVLAVTGGGIVVIIALSSPAYIQYLRSNHGMDGQKEYVRFLSLTLKWL